MADRPPRDDTCRAAGPVWIGLVMAVSFLACAGLLVAFAMDMGIGGGEDFLYLLTAALLVYLGGARLVEIVRRVRRGGRERPSGE